MKRLGLVIAFIVGAVVALAFAFDDRCEGAGRDQTLGAVAAGVCFGGVVLTLLSGRFSARPWIPWTAAVATAIVITFVAWTFVLLRWVDACAN